MEWAEVAEKFGIPVVGGAVAAVGAWVNLRIRLVKVEGNIKHLEKQQERSDQHTAEVLFEIRQDIKQILKTVGDGK